jgi:hypothetical protein
VLSAHEAKADGILIRMGVSTCYQFTIKYYLQQKSLQPVLFSSWQAALNLRTAGSPSPAPFA